MNTWFGNLSTMWKLMLGFAAVGAMMGIVGYIGVTNMGTVMSSAENIYAVQLKPLMTLTKVRGMVYQMRAQTITALLTTSPADREEALSKVRDLNKQVDESRELFAKTIRAEAVQKSYDQFTAVYDDYRSYRDRTVFGFLAAGESAKALAAMKGDGTTKFKASVDAINALIDVKMGVAEKQYDLAVDTFASSKVTLTGIIAGGVSLGLLIGFLIARVIAAGLKQVADVAREAATGNLTNRTTLATRDELGQLGQAVNAMLDSLVRIVASVREGTDSITAASTQISTGVQDLSQRTSEQASALEETSASMEEMTSTVKQNADNAKQANQLGNTACEVAERGGAVVTKAVASMEEINKSSKKIADIITVIDEIAFQTNLLALNAAVEAARAGEHGRGFAVVAAEVRNLAQRSAGSAKEIKGLINESVQKVTDGSELVNQSGKTLEEIVTSVKRVTDILAEISAASQEQAQGIDQVNKAIMQMDETTQQNAALVEQSAAASEGMQQQANHLQGLVSVFKVNANGAPALSHPAVRTAPPAMHARTHKVAASLTARPAVKASPAIKASHQAPEPAGIASGNGHDRRRRDDDFEEF